MLGAPAVAMAIDLYAYARVAARSGRGIQVSADIPIRMIAENGLKPSAIDAEDLLEPLRLAVRETLAYIHKDNAGLELELDCEIPIGAGLGSSAATTVAIIAATARSQGVQLETTDIIKVAFGPESFLHGKPSGVDHSTCAVGGVVTFTRPDRIERLRLRHIPAILVCDSGIHRSTRPLVKAVVQKSKTASSAFENHLSEATEISKNVARALKRGDDEELGELLSRSHELLMKIGVSHPTLDKLVRGALKAGSLGAKLTGAGGGGCMIAICADTKGQNKIAKALRRLGGTPYDVHLDSEGVITASEGEHSNRLVSTLA